MRQLYEHQKTALAFLDMNPEGLLVAYDVGTGKTMVALSYIHERLKRGEIANALIVCPAALIGTWEQAIDDCVEFGYTPEDIAQMKAAITLTSYQKTYTVSKVDIKKRDGQYYTKATTSIRPEIDRIWDVIICDESHNLGGHNSKQTRACITLATHARTRIAMSGTPLHGGKGRRDWCKLYGQVQFITAGKRWRNWSDYTKQYVTYLDKWFNPKGWKEEECQQVFQEYAISCRREDCIDLPGYTESKIPCDLQEKKMYNDIVKGKFADYGLEIDVAGGQYVKLLQIVSGSCKITENLTLQLKSGKDDALTEIINGTDEKIIVFCRYQASIDRCLELCRKAGRKAVAFDGRSKGETWRQFQEGDYDSLVIQYDSGSAGLNLQAAHICIFYEPTLSALKLEQAAGRIYRAGQKDKCTYYYLSTKGTIEERVWRTVKSGRDVNNDMLEKMARGEPV